MHPFPPAEDLKFLIGLELGQVCLDPWSTQFRFSQGGQITVEGQFEHIDLEEHLHIHHGGDERDVGPVFLGELLQQHIVEMVVDPKTLTLKFSGGSVLRIGADEGAYDCGQIFPPDQPERPIIF